eukprot:TRINITY_DN6148_c0_g1_i1.p1 TRINITY_DN6148_c0_g1~~TRINITY_DN6148_c0_g1_i1.p1  ORF type:complete len:555 (+),score=163.10 TRINITY_DN6148_c0_g1_i1:164-1828(+)
MCIRDRSSRVSILTVSRRNALVTYEVTAETSDQAAEIQTSVIQIQSSPADLEATLQSLGMTTLSGLTVVSYSIISPTTAPTPAPTGSPTNAGNVSTDSETTPWWIFVAAAVAALLLGLLVALIVRRKCSSSGKKVSCVSMHTIDDDDIDKPAVFSDSVLKDDGQLNAPVGRKYTDGDEFVDTVDFYDKSGAQMSLGDVLDASAGTNALFSNQSNMSSGNEQESVPLTPGSAAAKAVRALEVCTGTPSSPFNHRQVLKSPQQRFDPAVMGALKARRGQAPEQVMPEGNMSKEQLATQHASMQNFADEFDSAWADATNKLDLDEAAQAAARFASDCDLALQRIDANPVRSGEVSETWVDDNEVELDNTLVEIERARARANSRELVNPIRLPPAKHSMLDGTDDDTTTSSQDVSESEHSPAATTGLLKRQEEKQQATLDELAKVVHHEDDEELEHGIEVDNSLVDLSRQRAESNMSTMSDSVLMETPRTSALVHQEADDDILKFVNSLEDAYVGVIDQGSFDEDDTLELDDDSPLARPEALPDLSRAWERDQMDKQH